MEETKFKIIYNTPFFRSECFETEKFATQNIILSTYKLIDEKAPYTTLCGRLIARGTEKFDATYKLIRYLYSLKGAQIKTNTVKIGEHQVLLIAMKVLSPDILGENLFDKGTSLLEEIFLSPLLENGKFRTTYFNEEKSNLLNEIKNLINDRPQYALQRFIKIMCQNERFGISNLGEEEEVIKISNDELSDYYFDEILNMKRFLHFIGKFDSRDLENTSNTFKDISKPMEDKVNIREIIPKHKSKLVIEKEKIQQTWLFMGYRHNISSNEPLYGALLLFNAIFGKFSTSRLFVNLREKLGLCYYIDSSIPANKNIMIVSSGIIWKNYKRVIDETEKNRIKIATEDINTFELESARKLLLSRLDTISDDPLSLASSRIEFLLVDPSIDTTKLRSWIEKANQDSVKKVASNLWLDTVYVLKGEL